MDDVYHLGDFAFANHKKLNGVVDIINQLNGRIHFIKGNHCYPRLWQDIEALNLPHVEFVKDYHEISVDGIKVCMLFKKESYHEYSVCQVLTMGDRWVIVV